MNEEQAIAIIKQTIDESIKKGIIPNLETAQQIIIALSVIANKIKTEDKK